MNHEWDKNDNPYWSTDSVVGDYDGHAYQWVIKPTGFTVELEGLPIGPESFSSFEDVLNYIQEQEDRICEEAELYDENMH